MTTPVEVRFQAPVAKPRLLPRLSRRFSRRLGLNTGAATLVAALAAWLWFNESEGALRVFALSVTGALFSALALASRRALFAAATTTAIVAGIVLVSLAKRSVEGMVFHSWDFVQTLFDWRELHEEYVAHTQSWWLGVAALLAMLLLLYAVCWVEAPLRRRWWFAPPAAVCVMVAAFAAQIMPERGHTLFYWDGNFVSSFYRSFAETGGALWRGGLFERSAAAGAPIRVAPSCRHDKPLPHILLIHEESVTQPSLFEGLQYDHSLDPFFRSVDGVLHPLRVETYGGASWLTEFSVLTGMSARSFGSMQNFVQPFMRGRLRETVPQVLAACGYRNMMFTPWAKQFMAVARFYESIGIAEILDRTAQGNERENERDRFFFANVLKALEQKLETSSAPTFSFIETMSAHWPYTVKYEPQLELPGGAPGANPEVNEYLRRLALVKMDDDWLRAELARRFPAQAFLIVRYGDHHPLATRSLIGLPDEIEAQDVHLPDDSIAYTTFFAVNGVAYTPPAPPPFASLDVAYLGGLLLDSAGVPLPPAWRERLDIMRDCNGHYWACADHARILSFQQRLLDAGLVSSR